MRRFFLSPEEPRLRAGWRLLFQGVLWFALTMVFGLILIVFYYIKPSDSLSLLIYQSVSFLAITTSIYLARRYIDRRSFSSLGLVVNRQALRDVLVGVAIAGVMMGIIFAVEWSVGWLSFGGFAWQVQSPLEFLGGMLVMLITLIIVGWQEELLLRGYWLQNLSDGLNLRWGVLLSSGLFTILHWSNPGASWFAIVGLVAAGLFLAYGYVRTHQLWLPIGLHIGWNFFEGPIFGFQVSGLTGLPKLINQVVQGPVIFTGGSFGPEAGLVLLPGLLLGVILVYLVTSNRTKETGDMG
jgi:membrane protease YdiL (CAAX protease family)